MFVRSMLLIAIALFLTTILCTIGHTNAIESSSSSTIHYTRHTQEAPPQTEQQIVKDYELWDASLFPVKLMEWQEQYPNLIQVTTSQEQYNLPPAGTERDCPFYKKSEGCPNYFFTIQDYIAHPINSDSSNNLPEVFWSGCLHGNERVGPTSVMEAASLLLESAYCEGLPQTRSVTGDSSSNNKDPVSLKEQLKEAQTCRQTLRKKGIDDIHRKWLARLVTTRRIVVVPTANALGYYRNERKEGSVDPNRDFPYDLDDPTQCMQTIAGRTINEIYREHMFQLALTFHAGMEVVGYEWGAPSWLSHLAPDDVAQSEIGGAYSRYGGGWKNSRPYQFGTMNDLVYYVRGGMEDWAYAGSWTPEKVKPCQPRQFGGYPKEKTQYNNSTLRVFNMLIETSDNKAPDKKDLGNSLDVLHRTTKGNGHVSRNIRLALLAAEMVEPYVSFVAVNELALTDDIVPLTNRNPKSCMDTKAVMVARNAKEVYFEWTVGGAMTIDATELLYAKWDEVSEKVDCWNHPSDTAAFRKARIDNGANSGTGYFSLSGSNPSPTTSMTGSSPTVGPLFRATIPVENLKRGDKIMVIASARVDHSWKEQPTNIAPKLPPQSHIVNARTDPHYHHESNGKHIHGRLNWFSVPLTIVIGEFDDSVGTRDEDLVNTIEMYPRFGDGSSTRGGMKPKAANQDQLWFPLSLWLYLVALLLIAVVVICLIRSCCSGTDGRILLKDHVEDFDEGSDDFVFDAKPYSDRVGAEYGDDEDEDDGIEIPQIS